MHPTPHRPPGGHTLLEVAIATSLVAVLLGTVVPKASALADRWAVVGTRDSVAGLAHRVRLEARLHGGAALVLRRDGRADVRVGDSVVATRGGSEYGIAFDLGGPDSVVLRWDALGVGRVASRTIRVHRGGAEAVLVFSSTGRVRRR